MYLCTSNDEVIDLIQGGQGVFGIAINKVWSDVAGSLSHLETESLENSPVVDELAARRAAKIQAI